MFALGIHYLTGYATATDSSDYGCVEWPPHPARVFMAMVAALHEGCTSAPDGAERAALLWLEALPPPAISASQADPRTVVEQFVPVNDSLPSTGKSAELRKRLPGAVGVARNRQPRSFPKVHLQDPYVFLIWPEADASSHVDVLVRLCAKVTRIGHSSSLVQMWVADNPPSPNYLPRATGNLNLRVTSTGFLDRLESCFNNDTLEEYFDLSAQIAAVNGKSKKLLQADLEKRFGGTVPLRQYPSASLNCAYVCNVTPETPDPFPGPFDPNLLILTKLDGRALGLEATARLTTALRGKILKDCIGTKDREHAPEWLTGHTADGKPATDSPHIALLPLAFVGHEHADGHLLGMAIAFPRSVSPRERGQALAQLLYKQGVPTPIKLTLGALGVWTLDREERSSRPLALRADTWCRPSDTWATVTPVVLDRRIKSKTPQARFAEITASIAESCEHVGLPAPVEVDIDKNAFLRGSPRSRPDKSGFPLLVPDRQQIHVWLRFPSVVEGPVLLGAGRYRGYGFFKPVPSDRHREVAL